MYLADMIVEEPTDEVVSSVNEFFDYSYTWIIIFLIIIILMISIIFAIIKFKKK